MEKIKTKTIFILLGPAFELLLNIVVSLTCTAYHLGAFIQAWEFALWRILLKVEREDTQERVAYIYVLAVKN